MLESDSGNAWQPVAEVGEKGKDLRDPHLSITPDDRLMIVAGGTVYVQDTKTVMSRRPRVSFSKDARHWMHPQPVVSVSHWLWRVTWHEGKAWRPAPVFLRCVFLCFGVRGEGSIGTTSPR